MIQALVILLLLVTASSAAELKCLGRQGLTNVCLINSNRSLQLTHFRNRQHIYAAQLSPSERYAFVWHMDFRPRKLLVIDVGKQRTLAEFAPGVAGELEWSADDRIIHRWGFGTGAYAAIYDISGKELFGTVPTFDLFERCRVDVEPSRRALVMLPNISTSPGQITMARASDGKLRKVGPESISCRSWSWRGQVLQVTYVTNSVDEPELMMDVRLPEDWLSGASK